MVSGHLRPATTRSFGQLPSASVSLRYGQPRSTVLQATACYRSWCRYAQPATASFGRLRGVADGEEGRVGVTSLPPLRRDGAGSDSRHYNVTVTVNG